MELKDLGKMTALGVDEETYKQLLEIAKREGRSVVDVASEALRRHINQNQPVRESANDKRLLCEG